MKTAAYSEGDLTWGACVNGKENGAGVESSTDYETGTRTFYDAACTHLAEDAYVHFVNNSAGTLTAANMTISGTLLKDSQSGTVVSYDTITGTITGTITSAQATLQIAHAPNQTSQPTAQYGEACSLIKSQTSTPQACGLGSVAHVQSASADYGVTMNVTSTNGSTSTSVTGTVNTYTGAYNALTLAPGTFPSWTVSGGQELSSATLTGTQSGTSAYTLTDAKADATVTMTVSSSAAVNGTIKRTSTGATVATFVTDQYGNGTITYSNGATATITDWIITG